MWRVCSDAGWVTWQKEVVSWVVVGRSNSDVWRPHSIDGCHDPGWCRSPSNSLLLWQSSLICMCTSCYPVLCYSELCFLTFLSISVILKARHLLPPSTAFLPVWTHYVNARRNRCQEDLNSFLLGELQETTRTPSYYVDEDYPAGPDIHQPLPYVAENRPLWRLMSAFGAMHSLWCMTEKKKKNF